MALSSILVIGFGTGQAGTTLIGAAASLTIPFLVIFSEPMDTATLVDVTGRGKEFAGFFRVRTGPQ